MKKSENLAGNFLNHHIILAFYYCLRCVRIKFNSVIEKLFIYE